MRVLAVETSTLAGGVALLEDDRLVAEYVLDVSITHSERLLAAVDRVLADARWRARQLTGLAVAVGPGSFTGLRIAVSTVKGLALALGLPVAAVPTLEAMAASVPWAALPVCPVIDARKGEVFASLHRWDGASMRREWDDLALSPETLARRLEAPTLLIGPGAGLVDSPHARRLPPPSRVPSPAVVGAVGAARLRRGQTVSGAELAPVYLRPSEAELKRGVLAHA